MEGNRSGVYLFLVARWLISVALVAFLVWYLWGRVRPVLSPFDIEIVFPESVAYVSDTDNIAILGKLTKPGEVYLNGIKIETFLDFNFEEKVFLERGINVFDFSSVDRFGGTSEKKIYVYYNGK